MDEQYYMNTAEVANYLRKSPGAIRNLVLRRRIPFRKLAGRLLFRKSEINAWIDRSTGLRLENCRESND